MVQVARGGRGCRRADRAGQLGEPAVLAHGEGDLGQRDRLEDLPQLDGSAAGGDERRRRVTGLGDELLGPRCNPLGDIEKGLLLADEGDLALAAPDHHGLSGVLVGAPELADAFEGEPDESGSDPLVLPAKRGPSALGVKSVAMDAVDSVGVRTKPSCTIVFSKCSTIWLSRSSAAGSAAQACWSSVRIWPARAALTGSGR